MFIDNDIEVYDSFAKELGDNGQQHDACVTCWMAPQVGGRGVWVYLTTNGDPVIVGHVDDDNEFSLNEDAVEWFGSDDMAWLREALESEFMSGFCW